MTVNFVHLHLLLNHVPTIGTIIGFGLFLLAFAKRSDELERASYAIFFAIALASLPAYMTGYSAQVALKDDPGVSKAVIDQHQTAALLALIFMEATGILAWYGLWKARRPAAVSSWIAPAVLLLAALTVGLMADAANIGGQIHHPEILSEGQATAVSLAPESFKSANITRFQFTHPYAWPALEALHFIGLCLLFGVVLIGNLRILGFMKTSHFLEIHQLLPLGVIGFVVNSVTGMLFFIGQVGQYIENPSFHLKVVCMLLAGANVLYLTLFDEVWALGPGDNAPQSAKLVAASQVFLWVGVIYFGRMLPYLGNAF
jgi:uncharacterized membrane protein